MARMYRRCAALSAVASACECSGNRTQFPRGGDGRPDADDARDGFVLRAPAAGARQQPPARHASIVDDARAPYACRPGIFSFGAQDRQRSARLRHADAEGLPREPGSAARRRRRVLHAAVHRAADDPARDHPVACHRRRPADGDARAVSRRSSCRASRRRCSTSCAASSSHREVIGWTLAITLLFFSSLAFSVLENAMSVIFYHRVVGKRRPFVVSVLIPYLYILFLGVGLLRRHGHGRRAAVAGDARRSTSSAATGRCPASRARCCT